MKKSWISIFFAASLLILGFVGYRMFKSESGIENVPAELMLWVKCKACGEAYEIRARTFYEFEEANRDKMSAQPMKCDKCGKVAVYRAVKCEKCEVVFFEGSVPLTFFDTCPKCGFSKTKSLRSAAAN